MVDQEFSQLIESLGNMTAGRVSDYPVSVIRIVANEDLHTAHVTARVSRDLTDDEYTQLMKCLISVREFYLDELSIGFAVGRDEDAALDEVAEASGSQEFAFAGH